MCGPGSVALRPITFVMVSINRRLRMWANDSEFQVQIYVNEDKFVSPILDYTEAASLLSSIGLMSSQAMLTVHATYVPKRARARASKTRFALNDPAKYYSAKRLTCIPCV